MPQNDALLKAVEKLSDKIECFHTDFKQSIYYLINALNRNHEAENAENPAPPSQMDLFPTQRATRASVGVHRGAEREHFKFASDEKQNSDAFDKDVSQCIDSVAAEWKKIVKTHTTNTHKSIRNSALSSKYRDWLQRDPPFSSHAHSTGKRRNRCHPR